MVRVWVRDSACCYAGAGSSSAPAATTAATAVNAAWLQRFVGLLIKSVLLICLQCVVRLMGRLHRLNWFEMGSVVFAFPFLKSSILV